MIKTGNPIISIYTEMTPNPETMKFVANKLLYPGKSVDFPDAETAKVASRLLDVHGSARAVESGAHSPSMKAAICRRVLNGCFLSELQMFIEADRSSRLTNSSTAAGVAN